MKDLKYLAAFSIPLTAILGLWMKGFWLFATPVFAFGVIPLLELMLPIDNKNLEPNAVENKLKNKLFDWLLYLNLPLVYGILYYGLTVVITEDLTKIELLGLVFSVGIVIGVNGINVAHELGHRQSTKERFLGKALYSCQHYICIFI